MPPETRSDRQRQGLDHLGYLHLGFLDAILAEICDTQPSNGDNSFRWHCLAYRHQANVTGGSTAATSRSRDIVPDRGNSVRELVHVHHSASGLTAIGKMVV